MKFKKIILMGIISVIVSIGYIIISDKSIVSDSLSNVLMMKLVRDNASIELHPGEDEKDIKEIYDAIESTMVSFHDMAGKESPNQSEPDFIVEIYYKSGMVDLILTSETGERIYREVDSNRSYFGGNNSKLKDLVIEKFK